MSTLRATDDTEVYIPAKAPGEFKLRERW